MKRGCNYWNQSKRWGVIRLDPFRRNFSGQNSFTRMPEQVEADSIVSSSLKPAKNGRERKSQAGSRPFAKKLGKLHI